MGDSIIDKVRILFNIPELPTDLVKEALTVAGEDQKYPDGFKSLAQLGTTCINACFLEMGYKGSLRREVNSNVSTKYNSSVYRASVAKKNGIEHLIEYGKNGKETENNLAFAISALVATAYLTRGSEGVRMCVMKLGFLEEGSGLQMLQRYETEMAKVSVNSVTSQASSVQSSTRRDARISAPSLHLQGQPRSDKEITLSVRSGSHASSPANSSICECANIVSSYYPSELDDLGLVDYSRHCHGKNQGPTEILNTDRQFIGFPDSEPRQYSASFQFPNILDDIIDDTGFPVQGTTLYGSISHSGSTEMGEASVMAPTEEQTKTSISEERSRKRKNYGDDDFRKTKKAMAGDRPKWKALLLKENERCLSGGTKLPSETFFNEEIKTKFLEMQSPELLSLLLFQIADASAFVFLQEAVVVSKATKLDKPRKVSMQMSTGDRFSIMEKLDGEITYNALLKRYHLLELFRNSGGCESRESMVIIPVYADGTLQRPGRKGNPISNACADVTQRMMAETFPSLKPETREYEHKKRTMKRYRVLASRFQVFVDKFGPAILCFIQPFQGTSGPSWGISDNKIREISDTNLKAFIDILDQSQGNYLRSACKAAEPLLESLIYASSSEASEFQLERIEATDLLHLPKGSDELLFLLREIPRDGTSF